MVFVDVKINEKGQIVIPKVLRDSYGLAPGSTATLSEGKGELVLRRKKSTAEFMAMLESLPNFHVGKIDADKDHAEELERRWTT